MIRRRYLTYVALTALCLATIANHPLARAQSTNAPAAHTLISRNAQFTASGTMIPSSGAPASQNLMSSQPKAVALGAPPNGTGPYGLPVLPAKNYDPAAIKDTLTDLMKLWHPAQAEYAAYFTWMPWKIDIDQEAKNLGVLTHVGTIFHINYYDVTPPDPAITAKDLGIAVESVGTASTPTSPFVGAGFTPTPEETIFVVLDSFSSPVPAAVARNVQHDFASGFVTRLLLDAYVSAAKLPGHEHYAALTKLSLSPNGKFKANSGDFAQFTTSSTYASVKTLKDAITTSTASQPIVSEGLLLGWKAADELLSADRASGGTNRQKDAWSLLSYRYTFEELGTMVGYTLNYLSGEAMNERVISLLPPDPGAPTPTPLAKLTPGSPLYAHDLLQSAAASDEVRASKQLVISFGNVMEAEFYAVSQNSKLKKHQQLLLARYSNLMKGYREGVSKAANVIYEEITGQVYTLAYADGFRDGYALGYAAGWKDGYAQGNADAWKQANAIIGSLQSQIASLQSQLDNANSGGGGFWGDVGGLLNDGLTAISLIGSFF
jgi:hypothetical protein